MNAKEHARKMLVKRNHPLFEAPSKPKKEASTEKVVVQEEKPVIEPVVAEEPVTEVKPVTKRATKKKVEDDSLGN